jgi:hypothetical protein
MILLYSPVENYTNMINFTPLANLCTLYIVVCSTSQSIIKISGYLKLNKTNLSAVSEALCLARNVNIILFCIENVELKYTNSSTNRIG